METGEKAETTKTWLQSPVVKKTILSFTPKNGPLNFVFLVGIPPKVGHFAHQLNRMGKV
jgi:hypothetical protein